MSKIWEGRGWPM